MIARFLEYLQHERNRSPHTLTAYQADLKSFSEFIGVDDDLESLLFADTRQIREWLAREAQNGCSPRSLRRKAQSLRSFYNWGVKTGLIESNPASNLELSKIPKSLPNFVSPDEMEGIASHRLATDPVLEVRNHLIIEILYSYGLRQAELRSIKDKDIDMSRAEMKIHGKGGRDRVVPLAPGTIKQIREWQKMRDASLSADPSGYNEERTLITGRGWNPISKSQLQNIVGDALAGTKALRRSPHTLRHSFATAMLNGGADIMTVKEFLGHRSLSSTQIYTHLNFKELQRDYRSAHPRGEDDEKSM